MDSSNILIIGRNGQLSQALQKQYPSARVVGSSELDISNTEAVRAFDWSGVSVVLNAAAYTNVDGAETSEGRVAAWKVNGNGLRSLTEAALKHSLTLVHISTDYVFDGTQEAHTEDEPLSPLGVYAQTKAAGELLVGLAPKHYLLRSSWVIGSGGNFVRSIFGLGVKDISPKVVADQFGRLTFASELIRAIDHLLTQRAPYGTYNISNGGDIVSWADIAKQVYEYAGYTKKGLSVGDTTAAEYFAGKVSSPRPVHSGFDMSKLEATGFVSRDWHDDLADYIKNELEQA